MNSLSKITSHIGSILAEVQERNKLLEEARKSVNPTFSEIIEELENDDKTLCNMLLLWYSQKYLDNPIDIDKLFENVKSFKKKEKKQKYYDAGCGPVSKLIYGGAC